MSATSEQLARAAQAARDGRVAEAETLYLRVLATEPDNAEALRGLGALEFQTGRYDSAERRARRLLLLRPRDPAIHFGLGLVLHRRGQSEEAAQAYHSALALNPSHVGALIALAELYRAQRRFDAAVAFARQAVAADSGNSEACNLLGSALQGQGHAQEAVQWFETAARHRPADARVQYNLGVALQSLERIDEALRAYRQAVHLDPKLMEARNNLGLLLVDEGDSTEAIAHLEVAVGLAPQSAVARNSLGRALYDVGRCQDALGQFEHALQIDPGYAEAVANIGAVQRALGQPAAALATLERALALKPDLADAHGNRSMVLRDLGRIDEAAESALRAIAARPDEAVFHLTLALTHSDRGFHNEALESCRRAMALEPGSATLHRQFLGLLLYNPQPTAPERFAEARRFGARFDGLSPAGAVFADRLRDPERRLRIGYLSSDLRADHPVARNLRPIFSHHDRSRFEIFGYPEITAPDQTTAEFQRHTDGWRPTTGIGDEELARTIRKDEIDILVFLAGRFDQNRPQVAAYRAAPIQISFHDPGTSGLTDMDYLIADRILVPPHGSERFTERVLRLPHFYVHDPLEAAPPVRPLPLLAGRGALFGCFNNPGKLSDDCLALWARVLKELPQARLLLKFRNWYQSEVLRRRVAGAFEQGGVSADRLIMIEADRPGVHHLEIYNEVDVALDPLPFTGSTTTFEALWMGVPVITLAGDSMISRWTASMLDAVRLGHLAAATPAAYVAAAAELVSRPERLAALRTSLRARVAASPLCDGRGRTRQIERLYRAVWRHACANAVAERQR